MKFFTQSALIFLTSIFCWGNLLFSQNTLPISHDHAKRPILFIENKNQWDNRVQFKTVFEGTNTLFIENQGFTFVLTEPYAVEKIHDFNLKGQNAYEDLLIKHHAYQVTFLKSTPSDGEGIARKKRYHNYFLGNDKDKWAGHVGLFGKVKQTEIYEGINLEIYSQNGHLKYDLIVQPHADVSQIQLNYEGVDALRLEDGNLIVETSINKIIEAAPIAWQFINGEKCMVDIEFKLNDKVLSYHFPKGYNTDYQLIIDPTIIAATLSGTTDNGHLGNFGHSATFDLQGNIYTAGRSFGVGYPTTMGAFQTNYGGGGTDICVGKYNPDGSDMIYASYIGGFDSDFPHSIIADFNQQLYVFGSSASLDYPVSDNAFQTQHGGIIDIVITVLSPDGSDLVGSTFIGGDHIDGVNSSTLNDNYDDRYRGEIVLDNQNNIYVACSSQSEDFPTTAGVFGPTKNTQSNFSTPAQDAVIMKMSSDLSAAFWITFLGGDDADIGNGIRVDDFNNVYVTGTAGDMNFPTTAGTYQDNWPGGEENAYIAKISPDGASLLASTFVGSNDGDEHSFFLDLDEDDNVHIYGQTNGTMPITPDTYFFNPGSPQFLTALDNDLEDLVYSTTIGLGPNFSNSKDYVPVAFMVDKCNGIYFSGYYADAGLPTTIDALSEEGDNFYLGVLTPDAEELLFGTYYGDANHVDGGTSRFDKGGIVYQAVCSCFSASAGVMNTLPNAWATDQVTDCDVGVFKIDFEIETVTANGIAAPSSSGCAPYTVNFTYTGVNATTWEWSLEGEVLSNNPNHTYTFEEAGSYEIQLVAVKPDACNVADTLIIPIDVLDGNSTHTDTLICVDENLFLDATTANASYSWQDGSTGATFTTNTPGIYWVDVAIEGCARRDTFVVDYHAPLDVGLGPDTNYCDVPTLIINANHAEAVEWNWLDGTTNSTLEVSETGTYWVEVTDIHGCLSISQIDLSFNTTPEVELMPDTTLCDNEELTLTYSNPDVDIQWQNGSMLEFFIVDEPGLYWLEADNNGCQNRDSIIVSFLPEIFVNTEGTDILCFSDCNGMVMTAPEGGTGNNYTIAWETGDDTNIVENLCPADYEITVTDAIGCSAVEIATVGGPPPLEFTMTLQHVECAFEMDGAIEVSTVDGGVPPYLYSIDNSEFSPVNGLAFLSGGTYDIVVQDANECQTIGAAVITEPDGFTIEAGEDIHIKLGEGAQLFPQIVPAFGQDIIWTPDIYLNCNDCLNPVSEPTETTEYTITVTDPESGCFKTDSLTIFVEKPREVFIPNVFSPNGDGNNDFFSIYAGIGVENIEELRIFDRWGNMVYFREDFQPNAPNLGWDGFFKGKTMRPAVFTYYVTVKFFDGQLITYKGDLSLVR